MSQLHSSEEPTSLEAWVNELLVPELDKTSILNFFKQTEMGFDDLLQMTTIDEIKDFGIKFRMNSSCNVLWKGIQNLQQNNLELSKHVDNGDNGHGVDTDYQDSNMSEEIGLETITTTTRPVISQSQDIDMPDVDYNQSGISRIGDYTGEIDHTGLNSTTSNNINNNNGIISLLSSIESVPGGMAGLQNIGNTCFMNSAIQLLVHSPGFTEALMNTAEPAQSNLNVGNGSNSGNGNGMNNNNNKTDKKNKHEWLKMIKKDDPCDIFSTYDRKWLCAQIVSVKDLSINNNNSRKYRNGRNNNSSRNSRNKRKQSVDKLIRIHYRGFADKWDEDLYLNNNKDLEKIECPNVHCEHWRYDINNGEELDYFCKQRGEWIVAKHICYHAYKGYEIEYGIDRYGNSLTEMVGRHSDRIAPLGTYTNNKQVNSNSEQNSGSPINRAWNYMFGSNNNSYDNGYRGGNYNSRRIKSFYDEWLRLIRRIHINQNENVITPRGIYNRMVSYNPELSDHGQHDSIEAFTIILNGIRDTLPQELIFDDKINPKPSSFVYDMNQSIYDNDYKYNENINKEICDKLIETNHISYGNDIVSHFFQGIEMYEEICQNCGFGRKIFNSKYEISLPISDDKINIGIYCYSSKRQEYIYTSLNLAPNTPITWIKFLTICNLSPKRDNWSNIHKFELISLNRRYGPNFASILSKTDTVSNINKNDVLLLVPKTTFGITEDMNESISLNISAVDTIYIHTNSLTNNLYFCVISLPQSTFNHEYFKSQVLRSKSRFLQHAVKCSGSLLNDKDNLEFVAFCNGVLNEYDSDLYCLDGSSYSNTTNVIIGSQRRVITDIGNINDKNGSDSGSDRGSDGIDDDMKIRSRNDYNNDNDITNITQDKIGKEMSRIRDGLKRFNSFDAAKKHLESEIKYYEKKLNKSIPLWLQRFDNRCNIKLSEMNIKEKEILLHAHKNILQQLEAMQVNDEDAITNFEKKLKLFFKNNNIEKKNDNRYYSRQYGQYQQYGNYKQFNNLSECWKGYSDIKYILKDDLAPSMECECKSQHDTVPFASVETKMIVSPKLLIFSLARGKDNSKQNHDVKFGSNWKFDELNDNYELRGVCNHFGYGTKGGHYTANVKKLGTQTWYNCNDSHCGRGSYSTKNAIMMLYQKH